MLSRKLKMQVVELTSPDSDAIAPRMEPKIEKLLEDAVDGFNSMNGQMPPTWLLRGDKAMLQVNAVAGLTSPDALRQAFGYVRDLVKEYDIDETILINEMWVIEYEPTDEDRKDIDKTIKKVQADVYAYGGAKVFPGRKEKLFVQFSTKTKQRAWVNEIVRDGDDFHTTEWEEIEEEAIRTNMAPYWDAESEFDFSSN